MKTANSVQTSRFGLIECEAEDVLTFDEGLIGLPDLQEFVIVQHREDSPFRWMQSVDDPSIAFLVVDPATYAANYSPEMPESVSSALELTAETPILVYTICTIPNGNPRGMTLNLAGPVVINAESRRAKQVVLEDETCPVRFNVFEQASEKAA